MFDGFCDMAFDDLDTDVNCDVMLSNGFNTGIDFWDLNSWYDDKTCELDSKMSKLPNISPQKLPKSPMLSSNELDVNQGTHFRLDDIVTAENNAEKSYASISTVVDDEIVRASSVHSSSSTLRTPTPEDFCVQNGQAGISQGSKNSCSSDRKFVSPSSVMNSVFTTSYKQPFSNAKRRAVVRFKPVSSGTNAPLSKSPVAQRMISNSSRFANCTGRGKKAISHNKSVNGESREIYRALILTEEEKLLLKKENICLPKNYPLTRAEESELKRIRRKIRNKQSAQTSRKRKQDYIESLEDKVVDCKNENIKLKQQVEHLSKLTQMYESQLRKLQSSVANGEKRTSNSGTCLAVLLLSLCLIIAPHKSSVSRTGNNDSVEQSKDLQQQNQERLKSVVPGSSRTLMEFINPSFPSLCDDEEEDAHLTALSSRLCDGGLTFNDDYTTNGIAVRNFLNVTDRSRNFTGNVIGETVRSFSPKEGEDYRNDLAFAAGFHMRDDLEVQANYMYTNIINVNGNAYKRMRVEQK